MKTMMGSANYAILPFLMCCLLASLAGHAEIVKFELATIKINKDLPVMSVAPEVRNGTFHARQVTIKQLIAAAFGMTEPRILAPRGLSTDRFDIIAKVPEGVSGIQMKPMLQELLKDRFHLTVHFETRHMSRIYFLTSRSGGIKTPSKELIDNPAFIQNTHASMIRGFLTMGDLAAIISSMLGRPVIDKTGLTGRHSIALVYAPPLASAEPGEFHAPDIVTAVREQLGLLLKPGGGYVQLVVVDHVDRMPTEN